MYVGIVAICMIPLVLPAIPAHAQANPGSSASAKKEQGMSRCLWPFEVNIDPQPSDEKGGGAAIARMLLDKHFRGDLEATSKGTMLVSGTGAKGSARGYVALEIVTGTLKARTGTFVLQHSAIMKPRRPATQRDRNLGHRPAHRHCWNDEDQHSDRKHSYEFDYALPEYP
jgi:hypothetical protein